MKQIIQSLKTGEIEVADIPAPACKAGHLLIATSKTLVSAGTEKMLMDFGKAGWLGKAKQQPDKVLAAFEKIATDGVSATAAAIFNKLEQPLPLGYCNVGVIIEVGADVDGYVVGDRVVSNGAHAEVVCVPKNLCAKIPESVNDNDAVFTVIAAVALQGIRLAEPTLGESFVVMGAGIVGLMATQLLLANGCKVLVTDFDGDRLALAEQLGASTVNLRESLDPVTAAVSFSSGAGVDAVIIASNSQSNDPVHNAAKMCRKRGRIVLVGVTGLELSRDDFFKKELSFRVSASYGPGRYDRSYEQEGQDYPLPFVRWTAQRNFEAVLGLMQRRLITGSALITHDFEVGDAGSAYRALYDDSQVMGVTLSYRSGYLTSEVAASSEHNRADAQNVSQQARADLNTADSERSNSAHVRVGFIGAGAQATSFLMPAFKSHGAVLQEVVSSSGVSGLHAAKKFSFKHNSTDSNEMLHSSETDVLVITTRHDSHAELLLEGFKTAKPIFIEKPLCLNRTELDMILQAFEQASHEPKFMVGYNRRFAPLVTRIKSLLDRMAQPAAFVYTINAGKVPLDHWVHDPTAGGGRIIGEICHFVDLIMYLSGGTVQSKHIVKSEGPDQSVQILLAFNNGSTAAINYLTNGSRKIPKEKLEVFCGGAVLVLDNYRKLKGYGWPNFRSERLIRQDKGFNACVGAFLTAIKTRSDMPIALAEMIAVSEITFDLSDS